MYKEAKSPPDAVQAKLRQNKKAWNADVRAFIDNLIHLKKLMNGSPGKFYMQKGDIKNPIPADAPTIIGSLANDFNEIAQAANRLVEEQVSFSTNRRKRQSQNMKQTNLPLGNQPATPANPATPAPEAAPAPDLSQQLSLTSSSRSNLIKVTASFEDKYAFESEASNPLTRFWSKLKTPTMGWSNKAEIRRNRMKWLKACAKTWKLLEKFQVSVVGSTKGTIADSSKLSQEIWDNWSSVARNYATFAKKLPRAGEVPLDPKKEQDSPLGDNYNSDERDNLPTAPQSEKVPVAPVAAPVEAPAAAPVPDPFMLIPTAKSIYNDYRSAMQTGSFPELASTPAMLNAISAFTMSKSKNQINHAQLVIDEYRALLARINASLGTSGNSLAEIAAQRDAKQKTATAQLEVTAQAFLRKWLGKKRHQLLVNDTSSDRIGLFDLAEEMRLILDKLMDHFEDGLDPTTVSPLVNEMNSKMTGFRGMMRALNNTNMNKRVR